MYIVQHTYVELLIVCGALLHLPKYYQSKPCASVICIYVCNNVFSVFDMACV